MSIFSTSTNKKSLHAFIRVDSMCISYIVYNESLREIVLIDSQILNQEGVINRYDFLVKQIHIAVYNLLKKNTIKSIDRATIIFGEPWSHTIRRQISYQRKTPFKVTQAFIQDLIVRDQKKLIQTLYINDVNTPADLILPYYHAFIISGHHVLSPWNHVVNNITIDYSTGFSDEQLTTIIKTTIHEQLKIPTVNINVQHYQDFLAMFVKKIIPDNSLIIDWSGYTTDLSVVQQKTFTQTGTLPLGIVSIKQTLASLLEISYIELDSLLPLYEHSLLTEKLVFKIEAALEQVFQIWEEDFQIFCANAIVNGDIIHRVFWMNSNDIIAQFFISRVLQDTNIFPTIFGSTQVYAAPFAKLFDTIEHSLIDTSYYEQDNIILSSLF